MILVGGSYFALGILDALGLKDRKISSIDIHLAVGEPVTVTIKEAIKQDAGMKLIEVLKVYHLESDTTALGDTSITREVA